MKRRRPEATAPAEDGHLGDSDKPRASVFTMAGDVYAVLSWEAARHGCDAPLTKTERELLLHVLEHRSNAEIARIRARSVRTVENQLAALFRKLGVSGRSELVAIVTGR